MLKHDKLKHLLGTWPSGAVYTSAFLRDRGYSNALLSKYVQSGWINRLGHGAYSRVGDTPTPEAAVAALYHQLQMSVHVGGITSLYTWGLSLNVPLGRRPVFVYSPPRIQLPKWFLKYDWESSVRHFPTNLFSGNEKLGVTMFSHQTPSPFPCSLPERAILEVLARAPAAISFEDARAQMSLLNGLDPELLEKLLRKCTSLKVRRLFLYLAEQAGHQWFSKLKTRKISLGTGPRHLADEGVFNSKYLITVPAQEEIP